MEHFLVIMRKISTYYKVLLSLLFLLGILVLVAFFAYYLNTKKAEVFVESNVRQLEYSVRQVLALNEVSVRQAVTDYTYWDDMVMAIAKKDTNWANENIAPMLITFHLEAAWAFDTLGVCVLSEASPSYNWLGQVSIPSNVIDSVRKHKFYNTIIKTQAGYLELIGSTVHITNDPNRVLRSHGYYIVGRFLGEPFRNNLSRILVARVELTNEIIPSGLIRNDESVGVMIPYTVANDSLPLSLYVQKKVPFLRQYNIFSRELLWLLLGAAIAVLIVVWLTFSRWVTQPLGMIRRMLVTNNANADEKLKPYGYEFQEIGRLIKESVEQKKQLELLRRKAEESDRLKSSFLANMSHEIRTPLNGILGFSELISKRFHGDESAATYMRVIKGCSDDLLQIINDLLDISKLEADQMTLHVEKVKCNDLLGEIQTQYQANNLNKNNLELFFELPSDNILVVADRLRLKQIIVNLLNNALKFTEEGKVEVGCYAEEVGFAVFYVKDSGIGIPESQQELIFERFRQSDSNFTISRQYGGVGLGLSICKGLVDKMGGEISLCSVLGGGSTFFVRIPLAPTQ